MVEAEAWREQVFVYDDVLLVLSLPRVPLSWMVQFDAPGAEPRRVLPTDERDLFPVDVRYTEDGLVVYAVDLEWQHWLCPFGPDGFDGPWVRTDEWTEPWSSPYGLFSTEVGDTRLVLSRLHPTREVLGELAIGPSAVWGRAGHRFVVLRSGRFEALDLVTGERTAGAFDGKDPEILGELSDRLIFSARWRDTGREPWVFDADGPRLLQDILPGPASSFPEPGAVIDGQLIFSAVDLDFGREAFATDGASPPRLLFDLNPGPWDGIVSGQDPALSAVRAHVYFAGWDREVGVEPHRFPRALLTPDPEAECRQDADCPGGARCVGGACIQLNPPAPGADAGVSPDGSTTSLDGLEAGGCGCRASPRWQTMAPELLVLAALIVLARRRRQPH